MKDAIQYTVTVTATLRTVEKAGKEWARTTAEPTSPMAYTPEIEKTTTRNVTVFEQRMDTLNLAALVAVINNLPAPQLAAAKRDRMPPNDFTPTPL